MSYRVIQWYTGSIAREQIRVLPGTCFRWSPPPCAQGWTACTSRLARAKRDLLDGRVKQGTVGGIHLPVVVRSKGSPVVTEDLYWRLDDDLDATWNLDPDAGKWQITIEGDPTVKLGASLSSAKGISGAGQVATGARMVNSIRDVCDADPGILTAATAPMPRCWNFPNVA